MALSTFDLIVISLLLFFVAALYSSVGHGGASGYLAVLSLFAFRHSLMSSTALVLNVLVAGISLVTYYRAGHFSLAFARPFVIGSVPAAFLGGTLHVPRHTYDLLLAFALLAAAVRIGFSFSRGKDEPAVCKPQGYVLTTGIGAIIGLLSGIVGVGGGIFLGPILLLMNWSDVKRTAATCAGFILVNSLAALAGKSLQGSLQMEASAPFIASAFVGALVGSHLGVKSFAPTTLRRLLALVLLLATGKLLIGL